MVSTYTVYYLYHPRIHGGVIMSMPAACKILAFSRVIPAPDMAFSTLTTMISKSFIFFMPAKFCDMQSLAALPTLSPLFFVCYYLYIK